MGEIVTGTDIVRDSLQAQELVFVAAIRQGLAELDRGESVAIEDVEAEMAGWVIK